MKMSKLMAMVLALVMATAMAVPSLGAYSSSDSSEITFAGGTKSATLNLEVASTAAVIFNPYKLKAKMDASGALTDSEGTVVTDQVISKPFAINNKTEVPIRMGIILGVDAYQANGTAYDNTAISVVKAAPAATITAKQVFVYADFAVFDGASDPDTAKRTDAWSTRLIGEKATVDSSVYGTRTWDGATGGKLAITKNAGGLYVPAPSVKNSENDTNLRNTVYVKLGGAATAAPEDSWSTQDKLDVHMAMTFQACASANLYKLYMANYSKDSESGVVTYEAGVKVGDGDTGADGVPTFTIPYTSADVAVAKGSDAINDNLPLWKDTNKEKAVDGTIESGYVVTINPPTGEGAVTHTIKSVTFYDANDTKLTALKAVTTNSKDKTAPWTFTMPAQNVVIDIVMEEVT